MLLYSVSYNKFDYGSFVIIELRKATVLPCLFSAHLLCLEWQCQRECDFHISMQKLGDNVKGMYVARPQHYYAGVDGTTGGVTVRIISPECIF